MISRQKQIYELRKAVIDELKIRTVKKRMIAVLNNQQQVGSAKSKLQSVIQQMEYRKAVKVRKTAFDSETGFMYRATVEFEFVFQDSGYAKFLDIVPYSDIKYKSRGSGIENLIVWIKQKPISTWKNPYGIEEIKQDKKAARALKKRESNCCRDRRLFKREQHDTAQIRSPHSLCTESSWAKQHL